ncbi:MAG TPA: ABC transporter permease [Aestuariivirgaceae bacterium]|jgi:peptide/nickel transport system permease protein
MTDQALPLPARRTTFEKLLAAIALLKESRIGMIGLCIVLFLLVVAIIAPVLPIMDPLKQYSSHLLAKPMTEGPDGVFFWLGTDDLGRDLLSRLIWGAQRVFIWAGLATLSAYTTGMLMGVAAGYLGGRWDDILSFIGNLIMSFPLIVLYLVIIGRFGATPLNIIVAVTLATGPQVMRIVRGIVLDLKTRDYIAAAQVRGEHPIYIMLVELLPNARGPLIVDACLRMGYVTITIALLGYLGLGLPPPDPDWGSMINAAQKFGSFGANAMLWPAAAVSTMVLGLNMLADGLREISLRD